jgi:hypothetical protein
MAAPIDHDALFKLMLMSFFREFLELVAPELAEALDPEPLVFLDKESFSDLLDPDRREADLVVQAKLREQPATLLIHLEHQAQVDRELDRRMFRYFGRLYDRYDLPVYPIALCSYTTPRTPALDRHQLQILRRSVLDFRYVVLQLNRLEWRDFLQTDNPVAIALMTRMRIEPGDRWRVKAASLRLLAGARLNGTQRRLISQFLDRYLPLQGVELEAFRAEVATFAAPVQEEAMKFVTSWERQGRQEGQRDLVERMLTRKLGQLPEPVTTRLATLSSSQLTALGEALFDFAALSDLEQWLLAPPPLTEEELFYEPGGGAFDVYGDDDAAEDDDPADADTSRP